MYRGNIQRNRAITSSQVLIIDDSEISRKISEKLLTDEGFENISFAKDGVEGLKIIKKEKPRLIICDLFMPNLNGYEFCTEVRKDNSFSNIPIIIQTSASSPKDINQAYVSGANDVVLKPVQKQEFLSKIVFHIENSLFRSRIRKELDDAQVMQQSILPSKEKIKETEKDFSLEISSHFSPSSEVGGDFWGLKKISHSELAIFTVDLSGHGVAAALNTFRVSSLIEDENNLFSSPSVVLNKLNRKMKDFMPVGQFATIFYGIINTDNNTLKCAGAACPNPIILKKDGSITEIGTKGLPLGVSYDAEYKETEFKFEKGDLLMVYSDALIETTNEHKEFFDNNKVKKTITKSLSLSSENTLENLLKKFNSFIGKNPVADDLTINIYKRV